MGTTIREQKPNIVEGRVSNNNGSPLSGLKVVVYDIDMREWQLLAETVTDKDGRYSVTWVHSQLSGRGKKEADIAVKVFTKEKNTQLYATTIDEARFNASKREEINIIIAQELPVERIVFDWLVKDISFLANKIPISQLQQNEEHQDITFLAKELEQPASVITHIVVAHRLQDMSKIDAGFFFALFQKKTLHNNQASTKLKVRPAIDMNSDIQALLYDAALANNKQIEADIKAAVAEQLISAAIAKNTKRNLEILKGYADKAAAYYEKEYPQKIADRLSSVLKPEKLQELIGLFATYKQDKNLDDLLGTLSGSNFYTTAATEKKSSKTGSDVGKLLGQSNKTIVKVAKQKGIKKPEDYKKLARLNKAEWVAEIKKASPEIKDKAIVSAYASAIVRKMETEFPTIAFTAQLEREKKSVFNNQKQLTSFLSKNADFDLQKTNIDRYLKEKRIAAKESEAISNELKSAQRIFKLVPQYSKVVALKKENISSAQDIVSVGKQRFIKEIAAKAGMGETEAILVYNKAETRQTAAMIIAGEWQDSASTLDIASFETTTLSLKIEAISKDFPNLKSLFKISDTCACEHCRSVYSPAAYLVEILQFLDKRSVVAGNAKTTLFNRRPDLGEIDLSCANANTPVKYIDLVCELLEEAIAPDAGLSYTGPLAAGSDPLKGKIHTGFYNFLVAANLPVTKDALIHQTEFATPQAHPHYLRDSKFVCKIVNTGGNNYKVYRLRQTLATAQEVDAAPEYVNTNAYNELRNTSYAFKLPFDLQHTEAKAYLDRFGVDRANLMQTFQNAGVPASVSIAAERLGLTEAEAKLIYNAPLPNNNAAQQAFWNVPAPGNVLNYLSKVDNFLDRTGITYKQLDLLLKLKFIDPADNLFIKHNDLSCDTAQKEIANLDLNALDRIHRFLRLQKRTGWKYETLDAIITHPNGTGTLNDACLIKAAQIKEIAQKTGLKIDEIIGFFGDIPHDILQEDAPAPLYHQVFLNKAKNGVVSQQFEPQSVNNSSTLNTHKAYIATCLQVKAADLELWLPLLPNNAFSFANLSYLFAAASLSRKLKIKPDEFAILIKMSGVNISAGPDAILKLIALLEQLQYSPLKIPDIQYMLQHEAANLADRVIRDTKVEEILNKLKNSYKEISEKQKSKYDRNLSAVEQKEVLSQVLLSLPDVEEATVATILKFIDRDWSDVTNAAGAKTFVNTKLDAAIDKTGIISAIDALNTAPANADAQQKALVKAFLDSIALFFIGKDKNAALQQMLATSFKADAEVIAAVLPYLKLRQPVPGTALVVNLLSDNFTNPITPANYSSQYNAIRLLHKFIAFVQPFQMSNTSLKWHLQNNQLMNWLLLDGIPYDTAHTDTPLDSYLAFCRVVAYDKALGTVANPADVEQPVSLYSVAAMLLPASSATKDEITLALSILSGYDKADIEAIDTHFFPTFDKANYRAIQNWNRLFECAEYGRRLSASVPRIKEYCSPELTISDVSNLRIALKSRYDEDTWLNTLKEIMDGIRPKKRDALVAYLLATSPDIKDENDLYEYFLVDVEMGSCMPSSRIVQAHNTIQLFVQRCLMGLEEDAKANVDTDPSWKQWQWMKNYRVWEANRKVFLYPENWYDVTLTDDMTYLFSECINELQQNELTNDTAEAAFRSYLEKLDGISFLEVMASWYDTVNKNMHVFARTKGGDPGIYYYRRFEKESYWTPWEKVELDIMGDHLLAFIRNNRLHLAWPVFTEETNPNQKSSVPGPDDQGGSVTPDKPERRMKIQLAVSEYANKVWQPKRVSKDFIRTPNGDDYTSDDSFFVKKRFSLRYVEESNQVVIFSNNLDTYEDSFSVNGIFDLEGCKGYPELTFEGEQWHQDFYPDFKDAKLYAQKYVERQTRPNPDDLSVRNILSLADYYQLLQKTPGKFRITYPHQITLLDYATYFVVAWFASLQNSGLYMSSYSSHDKRGLKVPMGTLLPYFKENNKQSYVVIPGFYKQDGGVRQPSLFTDAEKRTVADIFKLIEDTINWIKRIVAEIVDEGLSTGEDIIQKIVGDDGFRDLLEEISKYEVLDSFFNLLIGKSGNQELDDLLTEYRDKPGLIYGEQFKNLYHPLVCAMRSTLYKDGIPALMKRETQLKVTGFNFAASYAPSPYVPKTLIKQPDGSLLPSYPIEDIDFSSDGSYSAYNWDLFYRMPLHIATTLTQNQRFEEALNWFHYMFNPTGALPGNGVQKFWVTKPFYLNQDADYLAQRIDNLMLNIADASSSQIKELEFAIEEWRAKPFKPDVIARFRPVAYQKALLMKYIDNLTEWGDYLFRQDTMESIAQATQMYILADKLLGPKPRIIPPAVKQPYETYNQIEAKLDSFGNALIDLENIIPDLTVLPEGGDELPPPPVTMSGLYFCIPPNEKMAEYWDRVADRLFKIRHCQNIDGIERSLSLFAPPIDPAMLVRAAAGGLDLSAVLAGLNAPAPYYRFNILAQKATELAQEVRGLGNALLQALEKKDAEVLSLLRSELEIKLLNAVKDMKQLQVDEAAEQIKVLERSRAVTEERYNHYRDIEFMSPLETTSLVMNGVSVVAYTIGSVMEITAGATQLIPDVNVGASGFGGSPVAAAEVFGGKKISSATSSFAKALVLGSQVIDKLAAAVTTMGSYERRNDEWELQERLAEKELVSIDQQIAAAGIRKQIAETDQKNHELQIKNAQQADAFMRSKFTNKDLYNWMIGQISGVYFKTYQLAHDCAKKAERSYRFELGNDDNFISYGYWDSMKKGLQSADNLIYDIKRMETAYLDKNKREYEIIKQVSLAQLDPLALVRLQATGACDFDIPEALYDMDHPTHYFRRLKSVSVSLPCIAGAYTSVSARLSLINNRYRKNTNPDNLAGTGYKEDPGNDDRFVYNIGAIQSIATSNAQNDSGMFELNFRDERYLPFEGTGAVSRWRLELPTTVRQFDYNTIADVILHVKYTAREGGSGIGSLSAQALKDQLETIKQSLGQTGLHVVLSLKRDLANEWHLLKKTGAVNLTIDKSRMPYLAQTIDTGIAQVMFIAKLKGAQAPLTIQVDGAPLNLAIDTAIGLPKGINSNIELDTAFPLSLSATDRDKLDELIMIVKYEF